LEMGSSEERKVHQQMFTVAGQIQECQDTLEHLVNLLSPVSRRRTQPLFEQVHVRCKEVRTMLTQGWLSEHQELFETTLF
ncbi:MAG: hypothetical protein AAGJ35_12215, partial [Myxococcota bacterium]